MPRFTNWSGDVKANPAEIRHPANEQALIALVKRAAHHGNKIRVLGAGHSFMPLCQTDDWLLSLENINGIKDVDSQSCQATVYGGTHIKEMGLMLHNHGLALANQGDVDAQAIAGAVSTGTHGSGVGLGSLATMVVEMKLVLADGETLTCSATQNVDIFKAAQVSMGMLGIITELRLQLVPSYKLHYHAYKTTTQNCLNDLERLKENRNFEFYYFPHTDSVQIRVMNPTSEAAQPYKIGNYLTDMVLENGVFQLLSTASKYIPPTSIPLNKLIAAAASSAERKCWSHEAYPTPRLVRFHEMEYNIPAERFPEVFEEVQHTLKKQKIRTHFPIECRFVKQDDIWLSPAYARESAYIAVHQYQGMAYESYFKAMEAIFHRHGGRPHWGKLNYCKRDYLEQVYPKFEDFLQIRRQLDPKGMFLNGYLGGIFE